MIRAVIFDLDGLLVDSEPVWYRVRVDMFSRFGMSWTDADQKALMGRSTQSWIDYVAEKLDGRLTKDEVRRETLDAMVRSYRSGLVRIMPGAGEALEYCRENYILGLASGSPPVLIEAALDAHHWRGVFREVLSSDEVSHGKPAPDVYLAVMKQLGIPPPETAVVEDSGSGILAGKSAGAFVVAVPNRELMPPSETLKAADRILDSLSSLPGCLQKGLS